MKLAKALFCSKTKRIRNCRSGSTAVEMAIISPVFFLMMIGLVELCLMLAAQQILESATFNASRLAKTGYTNAGQSQMQTVTGILNTQLSSFGTLFDTSEITMTSKAYDNFERLASDTSGTSGLGTATQVVVYTVVYPWKIFTPLLADIIGEEGKINITSRIVVRNEPYS